MSKMFIDRRPAWRNEPQPVRFALNGPTMGARFSAIFFAPAGQDTDPVRTALVAAMAEVEAQMSTYRADSALMRLNAEPVGEWIALPDLLFEIITRALAIERDTDGAFDIGVGDLVAAAGFGAKGNRTDPVRLARLATVARTPTSRLLEVDPMQKRVRKHAPLDLDLSGIAKGFGVDRLAEILEEHGITRFLVSIDGEMRAGAPKLDTLGQGRPWTIAVERPDRDLRAAARLIAIENLAIATSGDYRHFHDAGAVRLNHTMDPRTGTPLDNGVASVSVIAERCMDADALASGLMVLGPDDGPDRARALGVPALFMIRKADGNLREIAVGANW